jgi:hypothetical protein
MIEPTQASVRPEGLNPVASAKQAGAHIGIRQEQPNEMKLRVKRRTLRLRLTRPGVMWLRDDGLVEESSDFGAGATLFCRVRSVASPEPAHTEFHQEVIWAITPSRTAQAWVTSNEVGVCAQAGALKISIEKDVRCLTCSGEKEERDVLPHPADPPRADPGGATCRS